MCHKKEKQEMKKNIVALIGCLIIVTVIMFGTVSAEIRPERSSVGIFTGGYVFSFFGSSWNRVGKNQGIIAKRRLEIRLR